MPESPLVEAASQWVVERYPYNSHHLLRSLAWVDHIAPGSTEAVRLATLTHDMERAFPGPDQPVQRRITGFGDGEYNAIHSARSARIVGAWLREQGAEEALVARVETLIRAHEDGGDADANAVQAADSISFLETNIDLFLKMLRTGKRDAGEVQAKFDYTYERIQVPHAREIALPMYLAAMARLEALKTELAASGDGPG